MSYSKHLCPRSQRALEMLGKKWMGVILLALQDGPLRFSEVSERVAVISDRMLSERLKELESEGIVARHVLGNSPMRVEYELTGKGQDLTPVMTAIRDWSHRWIPLESPETPA